MCSLSAATHTINKVEFQVDGKLKHGNADKLKVVEYKSEGEETFYCLCEEGGTFERTFDEKYDAEMSRYFAKFADEKLPDPEGSDFHEFHSAIRRKYGLSFAVLIMRLYMEHWDEEHTIFHAVSGWSREELEDFTEIVCKH